MSERLTVLRIRLDELRGAPMLLKIEAADAALVAALAVLEDMERRVAALEEGKAHGDQSENR